MPPLPSPAESPIQETARIRNRGSYTIPEEARKAHRCIVDILVESVTREQYKNFMYAPPQGDFANVTLFAGASVVNTIKVKYPDQRLLDWVNIEASLGRLIGQAGYVVNRNLLVVGISLGAALFESPYSDFPTWGLNISHLKVVCPPQTQVMIVCQWWPFIDYPNAPEDSSDLDDPASGEDEYREPRRNPTDDPWEGNAASSGIDGSRDPRDFDEANEPPPPAPLGDDCTRDYLILAYTTTQNADGTTSVERCDAILRGKILSVSTKLSPDGGRRIAYVTRESCEGAVEEVNLVNAPVDPPFTLTVESVTLA